MMVKRLQSDLMEVEFNFSAMASAVSPSTSSLEVTAHYRAYSDYVGLSFNSKDYRMHMDARYPENKNYGGTVLSFTPNFTGSIAKYSDMTILPAMVILYADGSQKVATLGFLSNTANATNEIAEWTWITELSHTWIKWESETVSWSKEVVIGYEDVFDDKGNYLFTREIKELQIGTGERDLDYAFNYLEGTIAPIAGGGIPYGADLVVSYAYGLHQTYTINFNSLMQGTHPNNATSISNQNIDKVIFPVIPNFYVEGKNELTGRSDEVKIIFSNWTVSGGDLGSYPPAKEAHPFRLAEGYDDEYYRNPRRIVESMHHLGYRNVINLYVGASHYYDKKGAAGDSSVDHKKQLLIESVGVCKAAKQWLKYLCKAMIEFGFTTLIISVSMENLQMPSDWRQKIHNGEDGQTGWEPPTSFYSPVNLDVRTYYNLICRQFLDIVTLEGLPPILQLGEPWWWWQEFIPGNIHVPYPGRPPCFYDEATKAKFLQEKGRPLPLFATSTIEITNDNKEALEWLRNQLGSFSDFTKGIVKSYSGGIYTVLFFPPSVMDVDRVPEAMRIVNVPMNQWKLPNLDYIQIEDYDWVIHQNARHPEVFDFAQDYFNYQPHKSHYFSGFAWSEYGFSIIKQWELIENAAVRALSHGMSEVFIWAGTQIRRDSWNPKYPIKYKPRLINYTLVHVEKIE